MKPTPCAQPPSAACLAAVLLLALCPRPGAAQTFDGIFTWPGTEREREEEPRPPWQWWTDAGAAADETTGGQEQGGGGESAGRKGRPTEPGKEEGTLPAPLGPWIDPLNPARLQYLFDECLGLDVSKWSNKPKAPEIPLALYRETIRPLGALKYEAQPSFFAASFTGQAASQQAFSLDYVFADWRGLRFEYSWANGNPQTVLLGYQRTLGVGPNHNWVHALTFLPEYVIPTHFVGGSALYTLGWKPREDSPWTLSPVLGVNRVDKEIESAPGGGGTEGGGVKAIWRPFLTLNVFYTFSPSLTVGLENDALASSQLGEYVVMPFVNWRPVQHFFVQTGAGYYQIGSDSQATFMIRANLLWPSPRRNR